MQLHSAGETPRQRFDYRGRHRYTITLETHRGAAVFTARDNVLHVLSALREQALAHRFEVQVYCFLPSRLLLLVQGKDDESFMKGFLGAFRSAANEQLAPALGHPLWRRTYRERVLRKGEDTRRIAQEIWRTPVRENLARSAEAYDFQGSFVKWLQPGVPVRRSGPGPRPKGLSAGRPGGSTSASVAGRPGGSTSTSAPRRPSARRNASFGGRGKGGKRSFPPRRTL